MNALAFIGADQYYVIYLLKHARASIYGLDDVGLFILDNYAY